MNLLAIYCKLENPNALENDAVASLIQGLRMLYEEQRNIDSCSIRDGRGSGNPLIGNRDITKLRPAHQTHLAHLSVVSMSAKPLTVAVICDHAATFWYSGNDEDILLHATFVIGLNLGLRHDEAANLELKFVSVTSNSITLRKCTGVKKPD